MTKSYVVVPISLHTERDEDLIEIIERLKSKGNNISEICRDALRFYFGLKSGNCEDPEKEFYRILQLEKSIKETYERISEIKQSILEKLESDVSKLFAEIDKLNQELSILKQAIEQKLKEKEEEERRKKEEEERKRREELQQLIKEKFEHYSECARYGGLTFEQRIKLPKEIKELARDYGLAEEEVKAMVLAQFSNLKTYLEEGSRCPRLF